MKLLKQENILKQSLLRRKIGRKTMDKFKGIYYKKNPQQYRYLGLFRLFCLLVLKTLKSIWASNLSTELDES